MLLPNLGGSCPSFQDHRKKFAIAQQPAGPQDPADFDTTHAAAELPADRSAIEAAGPQVRVRSYSIRQVGVVEVAGRLSDVVWDLDHAIQVALAERSRGVVCDLSAMVGNALPGAVEVLATAGRHVRDWPGIPVAVACPDPQVREALLAHPLGRHLIVTESLFSAMTAVLATRPLTVERLRLAPHPTAPRAARDFVNRALLGWRLGPVIPMASLVISELVAHSTMDATTDLDLTMAWHLGVLRLSVRDNVPDLRRQPYTHLDPHGRRLSVVAVLSRSFGVLPTADGGKVVWAVLDAPRPRPSTSDEIRSSTPEPA